MQFFENYHNNEARDITPEQVIELIRKDEVLKANTVLHRDFRKKDDEKAATKVKESTPPTARPCIWRIVFSFLLQFQDYD